MSELPLFVLALQVIALAVALPTLGLAVWVLVRTAKVSAVEHQLLDLNDQVMRYTKREARAQRGKGGAKRGEKSSDEPSTTSDEMPLSDFEQRKRDIEKQFAR